MPRDSLDQIWYWICIVSHFLLQHTIYNSEILDLYYFWFSPGAHYIQLCAIGLVTFLIFYCCTLYTTLRYWTCIVSDFLQGHTIIVSLYTTLWYWTCNVSVFLLQHTIHNSVILNLYCYCPSLNFPIPLSCRLHFCNDSCHVIFGPILHMVLYHWKFWFWACIHIITWWH